MTDGTSVIADVIIGMDAGTSVLKAVAFTLEGDEIGMASRPNSYRIGPDGAAEQDMERTWAGTAGALRDLTDSTPGLRGRVRALAVTGQGDGTWLIDSAGNPVGPAWLWLDGRAAEETRRVRERPDYQALYDATGTGVAPCQQSSQLAWMVRHTPDVLQRAATAFHCKDWLYYRLTGQRVTDPSEAVLTFGNFRTRQYSDEPLAQFGLESHARLLPDIVDGMKDSHPLTREAADATGLPEGLPVILGYIDGVCTALGGGIHDPAGGAAFSIIGSTGVHMRYVTGAQSVRSSPRLSGYTMCCPLPETYIQMHSNLSGTLNIDWLLDLMRDILEDSGVSRSREDLMPRIDALAHVGEAGRILYHPYISPAGERGPFLAPEARASFTGLDSGAGLAELARAVLEGLAYAARDCHSDMGPVPPEVRLAGGASRSSVLRAILGAVLDRRLRRTRRDETGAAGAAMIAAMQQGIYTTMEDCTADWVTPLLTAAEAPDPELVGIYEELYPLYVRTREALAPVWSAHAAVNRRADR